MEFFNYIFDAIYYLFDFILHIDKHLIYLTQEYGAWLFLILFLIIFCETGLVITPFLPGDSLLFITGSIAATGAFDVHMMSLALLIAAILGDTCNYHIGQKLGLKLFQNPNSKLFKQEYLSKTQAFYKKYGGKTIILARFVPIVRTFAPFVAGVSEMTYSRFIMFNVVGAVIWIGSLMYLGYFFGQLPIIQNNLSALIFLIIFLSILPIIIEIIRAKLKKQSSPD